MTDSPKDLHQNVNTVKSKMVAGFLALFLGFFGVDRFYLGERGAGFAAWLIWLPAFAVGNQPGSPLAALLVWGFNIYRAVRIFSLQGDSFDQVYNGGVKSSSTRHQPETVGLASDLTKLDELRRVGSLTDEEFRIAKDRILKKTG